MSDFLYTTLYRLLFKVHYRDAFLKNHWTELNVDVSDRDALAVIDQEELVKTVRRINQDLLSGNVDSSGGLRRAYQGVFGILKLRGVLEDQLVHEFATSKEFDEYSEVPYAVPGTCLEEAFFRFLIQHPIVETDDRMLRELLVHEFCSAMLSILTVNPQPAFSIRSRDRIRHNGHVWYAIEYFSADFIESIRGSLFIQDSAANHVPYLYCASSLSTFINGPILEEVIPLIHAGGQVNSWGKDNVVPGLQGALDTLRNLGVVP
jgi:hypothetical protein